jgi:mannose-1-phosphate guanylyltransferase
MKALILAAGFGTRLAPHTRTIPKALFPVAGIPVLERMITHLKRAGCTGIAVNAHHLADRIQSYLAKNDFGVPVTLSREPEILGTGGAIRHLAGYWDNDPFIVVNADIVTDIDLAEVYHRHLDQDASVTPGHA